MAHLLEKDPGELSADDMRELFDYLRGVPVDAQRRTDACAECKGYNVLLNEELGHYSCADCGVVQSWSYYVESWDDQERITVRPRDGYKPIHHWHERMAQYHLQETPICAEHWGAILAALRAAKPRALCKETLRRVLRSIKLQRYNENWLQIIHRLTGYRPPPLHPAELQTLDVIFEGMIEPFRHFKPAARKNLLNYNFIIYRMLQLINRTDALPHFPQLKTRQKWLELDAVWEKICDYHDWAYLPMPEQQWLAVPMCDAAWERAESQQYLAQTTTAVARPARVHTYANRQLLRQMQRTAALHEALRSAPRLPKARRPPTRAALRRTLAARRQRDSDEDSERAASP